MDARTPQSGFWAHNTVLFTALTVLPGYSLRVLRPLLAVVRPTNGVYLASLVVTDISASGESSAAAVDNLKDIIVAKFHLFSQKKNILGERPERQLRTLQRFLRAGLTASK